MAQDPRGKIGKANVTVTTSALAATATPAAGDLATFYDVSDNNAWSKATLTNIAAVTSSLALHPNDDAGSIFLIGPVTHDFGSAATAVATKITDSAPVKTRVLAAILTMVEAKTGGSGDDVTKIAKEAAGTTAMTGSTTLDMSDTVFMNHLNSVVGVIGVTGADGVVAAGEDIYAYTDAQTGRTAGQYSIILICQKTA